jgi:hypothetical protein
LVGTGRYICEVCGLQILKCQLQSFVNIIVSEAFSRISMII